jgi:hypothetical protein
VYGNFEKKTVGPEPDVAEMLSTRSLAQTGLMFGHRVRPTAAAQSQGGYRRTQEALMVGMRSDRARARARDLLATVYPAPDDAEFGRLRELAIDYIQEAERLEAANRGRAAESDELISAALDAVARDYFARALSNAKSRAKR